MLILLSGEDSGWFMDFDLSLSLSYSDNDEISRPRKEENERVKERTSANLRETSLPKHDIGDGDDDNDGDGDEDCASDGYDGVQTIDSVKLCFYSNFQN